MRAGSERVEAEKAAARLRSCDFCAPSVSPAIASDVVAVATSGPGASPAVTLDQGHTGTMANDADGHPPIREQDAMSVIPTGALTTDRGKTEPTLEPAAPQPTRIRSSRLMHSLNAESDRKAALERTAEPERAARRRLSPEQQREVARLYAEGTLPTSEIRKRFGIGEPSLYRIVQRQGVPLRGRAAATPEPAPPRTQAPHGGRGRSSTANGAQAPAGRSRVAVGAAPTGSSRRGGRGRASRASGRGQFRIHFRGERVIQARDIRDALRQAESLGPVEVTGVIREN
jgi:transposase-like protein